MFAFPRILNKIKKWDAPPSIPYQSVRHRSLVIVALYIRTKEEKEICRHIGAGLAKLLGTAQFVQRSDAAFAIGRGPLAGVGHQNGDQLPPDWTGVQLLINDVAVIDGGRNDRSSFRHGPKLREQRPQINLAAVHGASAGSAGLGGSRRAGFRALHGNAGMNLESIGNKTEKAF